MPIADSSRRRFLSEGDRWDQADKAHAAKESGRHGLASYARATGQSPSTLRRWARVARAFSADHRQVGTVSFSTHEAIASHPDRCDLVRRVANEGWSPARLRSEAAAQMPAGGVEGDGRDRSVVRELGPKTLDDAVDYCKKLASFETATRSRLRNPLFGRVEALANIAAALAKDWDAGLR